MDLKIITPRKCKSNISKQQMVKNAPICGNAEFLTSIIPGRWNYARLTCFSIIFKMYRGKIRQNNQNTYLKI